MTVSGDRAPEEGRYGMRLLCHAAAQDAGGCVVLCYRPMPVKCDPGDGRED